MPTTLFDSLMTRIAAPTDKEGRKWDFQNVRVMDDGYMVMMQQGRERRGTEPDVQGIKLDLLLDARRVSLILARVPFTRLMGDDCPANY